MVYKVSQIKYSCNIFSDISPVPTVCPVHSGVRSMRRKDETELRLQARIFRVHYSWDGAAQSKNRNGFAPSYFPLFTREVVLVSGMVVGLNLKALSAIKKHLQITLEIKKITFQSQHVPFFLTKLHNFYSKTTFYRISFRHWALFLSIRYIANSKISQS